MLRSAIAVAAGFLVFAAALLSLFVTVGHDPHNPASMAFIAAATVYGMLFAALGGFVAVWLAKGSRFQHAFAVAFLIAVLGAAALLGHPEHHLLWPHIVAFLIMAPMAMVGGYIRLRQMHSVRK
jgi:MFS-type transporter involved in bile tolerance (Atg22 family)